MQAGTADKQPPTHDVCSSFTTLLLLLLLLPPPLLLLLPLLLLQVTLVVATAGGLLYEYSIEQLSSPAGPKCSLGGEWTLLGSSGLSAGT
jgi:hypothetical protein